MKNLLLTISLVCLSTLGISQTNISGFINSYTQVLGFNSDVCLAEMTVDDAFEFSPGDSVIIIQMKGATADQTNTNTFGDLIAPGNAGKYEKCRVNTVVGNVIGLDFQLVNTYDVSEFVQLVRVPHYPGNVNITGVLTAFPWDGTTGGVLAFTCAGTVTMNANIDMSGLGFSGGVDLKLGAGASVADGASCIIGTQGCVGTDYFYAAPSSFAVEKGEGLVTNILGIEVGKGNLVNAGGGGGMSYGGGGGGGNFGAGGAGGGCNDNECGVLCAPCNEDLTAGLGAQNLAAQLNNVQNRIFLGGGGGSGNHGNSTVNYFNLTDRNGRPGGGIIIIEADQIIGNGNFISAAGDDGTINSVTQTGGTGGGGGGGTVVLSMNNPGLNFTVDVSGGRGNDAFISSSATTTAGAGGGGGGGVYWSNVVSPTVTLDASAGTQGISRNTSGVVGGIWQGTNGSAGGSLNGLAIPEGSVPAGAGPVLFAGPIPEDTIRLCEGNSYPIVLGAPTGQSYQWQIDSTNNGGGPWDNLANGTNYNNVDSADGFLILNVDTSMNGSYYRLIVYNACDSFISDSILLEVSGNPVITLDPASQDACQGGDALFYAEALNGVSYQWQQILPVFMNLTDNATFSGTQTDSLSITNIPASLNGAIFRLRVTNACNSVFSNPAFLNFTSNPISVDAISSDIVMCEGQDTFMYVQYTGNVDTIRWQLDSGAGFVDLSNNAIHQGVNMDTLILSNVPVTSNGHIYRVVLSNDCGTTATSVSVDLTVNDAITVSIANVVNGCEGNNLSISSTVLPVGVSGVTYQWQIDTSGVWENLTNVAPYSNTNASFLQVNNSIVDPSLNTTNYRVIINTPCGIDTSNSINPTITPSPVFTVQPINDTVCPGDTAMFSATVTNGLSFQWQSNEFGPFSNLVNGASYGGATSPTLSVFNVNAGMNGVVYRLRVQGNAPCGLDNSANAQLFIGGSPVAITDESNDIVYCPRTDTIMYITLTGNPDTIIWQVNTGGGFVDLAADAFHSNVNADTLNFIDIDASLDGNIYRAIIQNSCGDSDTSELINLNMYATADIVSVPDANVCEGDSAILFFSTTGPVASTQWQISNGAFFVDIVPSATYQINTAGDTLIVFPTTVAMDGDIFNVMVTDSCGNTFDSDPIFLSVSPRELDTAQVVLCNGDSLMLMDGSFVSAAGNYYDTIPATNSADCDTILTYELSFFPIAQSNDTIILCFGDSLQLSDGSFVNTSGDYNDTIVGASSNGCDSFNIINLSISPQITGNEAQTICFGDSFALNDGSFVNATGVYNDTISGGATNGCDSVNILNLTVSPQITGNDTQVICLGDSFMLSDGTFVNSSGTYNDTITGGASNGCDSLNIIDLTVSPEVSGNDTQVLCFGDSLMLSDGSFVNTTGVYNDTIPNAGADGCDSVVVIDLTISPLLFGSITVERCFGDSFQLSDGSFVNATGIYNDTITGGGTNGCDTITEVDLTILPLASSAVVDSFCSGGTYTLASGAVVDSAGTYMDTLVAVTSNGCDSVITYTLNVQSIFVPSQAIVDTLCAGDIYTFPSGDTTSFPGMYNDTLTGSNGCDSIVVFDIQPGPTNSFSQQFADLNVCIGTNVLYYLITPDSTLSYQWMINGVDVPGETTDSLFLASVTQAMDSDIIQLRASGRCDTVVSDTSILTIIPPVLITADPVDMEVCVGDSAGFSISTASPVAGYLWYENGVGLAGTNDSVFTIPVTSIGQDGNQYSVEIIDSCGQRDTSLIATLTVNQFIENTVTTLCFGDSLQLSDGSFVNATGTYNDTLVGGAANGCDSINVIDLTISPQITGNETQVVCFGDSFQLSDGSFVNATGIYNDTLTGGAANGCDSVNIVDLTVSPQITGNDAQVICFGDSFQLSDGSFVNATGIYNDTLTGGAANGCDSVNIVDLTVSPQITGNDAQVICFGDSFQLSDGSFVNATGIYNDTLTGGAANGCDSVNIVDLTVSPQITGNDAQVICFGDSFQLSDGSFVNATGIYNDTIVGGASNTCDSVNIVDLTVSPQITGNDTQVLCFGDSLQLSDGSFVNATGTYNDTIVGGASNTCDSVNIIDLTIRSLPIGNDTQVLCFGDSLQLSDGSFVNTTGTYNDTILGGAITGCDSLNIIDLTISPLITSNDTQVLCFGDSLQLSDGSFVNTTGTYNDTLVSGAANGCDSVNIIDLTISPLVTSNDTQVLCFGDSLQLSDGSFVNATGTYNDTLFAGSSAGCDSIHIIDLTISPLVTSNDTQVLCFGDSLQLSDGSFVNATGTYNDTLVAASSNGCDSVNIIDLTISPLVTSNDTQVLCFGDSLQLSDGSFVNTTGEYNDTLVAGASNGCDSVNIIDLTILPLATSALVDSFCSGGTYTLASGTVVDSAGTYSDTLFAVTSNSCDSVITYTLSIESIFVPSVAIVDTLCPGDIYTFPSGDTTSFPGMYNDTITASNGCDSIVVFDIQPGPTNSFSQQFADLNVCIGTNVLYYLIAPDSTLSYQWMINGVDVPGETSDSLLLSSVTAAMDSDIIQLRASGICDTVVSDTSILTVIPQVIITTDPVDMEVCVGDSAGFSISTASPVFGYLWYENGVGLAGTNDSVFTIPITTIAQDGNQYFVEIIDSCGQRDTSLIATLTVNQFIENTVTTLCFGDSLQLSDGSFVNATGIYNDTLVGGAANGCDSVNIVDLTVSPQITGNDPQVICFGDSFQLSDGSFVNATGIYNDTLIGGAANGCDSVNIVDLTVSPQITGNDAQVICFGDSFQLSDGSFVNATGIYNDTLTGGAANGCDSVNIVDLTVSPQITGNDTQVICFGDSLQLSDGSFVNTTGMYNDTIIGGAANGCDSVNIIDLTISPQVTGNDTQVLCFGDSLLLSDGSFVNATGTYNDTITGGASNGCDSVNIIDLTIRPLPMGNDTQVLCFGDSLMLSDGSFASSTGTYNDTITGGASTGCDSLNIIDLTISPLITSNDTQVLCFGDSLQLSDGTFVNATGVYNDTLVSGANNGCDSVNIIDLTISPLVTSNDTQVLCFGDSLQLSDGSFVNATGIYNDTLVAGATSGCDSIHIIDLTISPLVTSNDTQVLCFGDSLQLSDGSFVNTTGTYNDTLVAGSSNGCDSINIIDLTISPLVTSNDTQVLCFGDSLQLSDGSFVNATGTYNDTLIAGASSGCDSINIIDLTISPQITGNDTQVLCFGDSLMLSDGSFVDTTGMYNDTIIGGAANGCDSVNIIDLTISPQITGNDTQVLCFGDSLMLSDGSFVNATGTYNDTIIGGATNGCDSVNIIDLTISPLLMGMDTQMICSGDSFQLMNGSFVSVTGIYNDTIVNGGSTGCDTIIAVDLTVLPIPITNVVDSFCAGGNYTLASGTIVTAAGIYPDTLVASAANGCDSVIIYDLSIIAAFVPSPPVEDTICFNETYTLPSGIIVSAAGIYNDTIQTGSGCDSIFVVDLFVRPANSIIQQSGNILLCIGDSATFYVESANATVTYQWTFNGIDVVGGTNDTLVLPNVNAGNDGTIVQVRVMGLCDTIFSNATLLNVRQVGAIVTDPVDMTVCAGDSAGFNVTTNIPVASFAWFENGIALAGATNASFEIPATLIGQDGNQYFCIITDSCGTTDTSLVATLNVNPTAQIGFQSIDQTVCAQDDVLFFVNATGTNVTYQWLLDGAAIPGETNDSLSLLAVTAGMDGNVYSLQLTSDCGNLTSNDMLLTVNDTVVFADQSVDISQCGGFSFDVFIDATNIATYQWQINQGGGFVDLTDGALGGNGTQVSGANTAMLTVSNYDLTISGAQFQVITTVNCGNAPIYTPVTVTITSPEIITDKVEDTIICLLDVSPIFVPYVDGAALWSNGDFGQFFEPTTTGDYIVEFTDQNNCPQSDTIFVQVDDCVAQCVVTAPTGFSPNGSGANDIFRAIYTCDLSFFQMQVYNRYGELVFMTNEPLEGWDGVFKGNNAEIGTYTWYISYQKEGATSKEDVKGNITLIR